MKLRLGSSLAAGDIKEGDDVYFECHVRANPPARKLSWLHDVSTHLTCALFLMTLCRYISFFCTMRLKNSICIELYE